jgi:hypothetical protein
VRVVGPGGTIRATNGVIDENGYDFDTARAQDIEAALRGG